LSPEAGYEKSAVIPTKAKWNGEPALSEVEGDLLFFLSIQPDGPK
jgi:hypothetical protein